MRRTLTLLLAVLMCLSLCACGKSEAVKNVETLITAIGEVTLDSEAAIVAAEEAYAALTAEEKEQVENYALLTDARAAYDPMLAEELEKQVYYGEWLEVSGRVTGGKPLTLNSENYHKTWALTNNGITLDEEELIFEDCGDFVRLIGEDEYGKLIYIPVAQLTMTEIEITLDNWEEYISLEPISFIETNEFGDTTGYFLYLMATFQDEIADRIVRIANGEQNIVCEFKGNLYNGSATVNEDTMEFTVQGNPRLVISDFSWISEFTQSEVYRIRDSYYVGNNTLVPNGFVSLGCIARAYPPEEGSGDWDLFDYFPEYSLSRIQGTLLLYDYPVFQP